jgi:hypothetical protein
LACSQKVPFFDGNASEFPHAAEGNHPATVSNIHVMRQKKFEM